MTVTAPESLRRWLAFLRTPDCVCPVEYRGLGRLYGVSMGKGWIRMDVDPQCPYHGPSRQRGTSRDHTHR